MQVISTNWRARDYILGFWHIKVSNHKYKASHLNQFDAKTAAPRVNGNYAKGRNWFLESTQMLY